MTPAPRRTFLGIITGLFLLGVGGCGGSSPSSDTDGAQPGSGTDGATPATAPDGPVQVPAIHRAAGSICPAARGPGMICTDGFDEESNACAIDADCTAGTNGRCFSPNGPNVTCSPTACSYDDCASDDDCPSHVPCLCRVSAGSPEANLCAAGGNCATDADCGRNGFCSPGAATDFCATPLYFCHTVADTCLDDADCSRDAMGYSQTCNYDLKSDHFACGPACLPPP